LEAARGFVSEGIENDSEAQPGQQIAIEDSHSLQGVEEMAKATWAAVQRLQVSVMSCRATVDYSRAQVTASRTLLSSLRRDK
jgi:hypothetical protein